LAGSWSDLVIGEPAGVVVGRWGRGACVCLHAVPWCALSLGVIEIVAGLLVAWRPRWGAPVVALWLLGIIVDLVSQGTYWDIALRDFGLLVAALALSLLASAQSTPRARSCSGFGSR
jgi:hypothetical protein